MRSFLEILAVLCIALGIGGVLSWYSIQNNNGFGALRIGQWIAWPLAGSVDADPYTKAKVAAEGEVPLGAAEGLAFHARADDAGEPLIRTCQYRLSGLTPPARLWTLSAASTGADERSLQSDARVVLSREIVRGDDGHFDIQAGPEVASPNWLQVEGEGEYVLILRLYDSPITSTSGIVDPVMPEIEKLRCVS